MAEIREIPNVDKDKLKDDQYARGQLSPKVGASASQEIFKTHGSTSKSFISQGSHKSLAGHEKSESILEYEKEPSAKPVDSALPGQQVADSRNAAV